MINRIGTTNDVAILSSFIEFSIPIPNGRAAMGSSQIKQRKGFPSIVKLQSSLTVQSKSVGLGVDFVFPPSQLTNNK